MKKDLLKKILFYLLVIIATGFIPCLKKEKVNAAISGNTGEELGYAVNVVNYQNAYGYNMGAPILEEDFLRTLVATSNNNMVQNETTYKATSFSEINKKKSNDIKGAIGADITYDIYTGSTNYTFQNLLSTEYKTCESQYYGMYTFEKVIKSLAIPNYAAFSQTYERNYSNTFIYRLEELGTNPTLYDFQDFFNEFGTHVIVGAKYGGKLESYYSVISNTMDYTNSVRSEISQQIDLSIANFVNAGESTKLTFANSTSGLATKSSYNSSVSIRGGITRYETSIKNQEGGYINQWKNSISTTTAALIGFTEGGLLPLWRVLPSNFAYLEEPMEEAFISYVNGYNTNINKNYDYVNENLVLDKVLEKTTIRSQEIKVTDDGRFTNPYDVWNLKTTYDVYLTTLKEKGIKRIIVQMILNVKEINDGYQYVFLYNKNLNNSSNKLLDSVMFEHGGTEKDTTYSNEILFFSVLIDDLLDENIYIFYGASGEKEDDLMNKEVYIRILFTNDLTTEKVMLSDKFPKSL